jgi:hypothetical protein
MKKKGMFGSREQTIDLDASALLFDAGGRLVDQVWFRQLKSKQLTDQRSVIRCLASTAHPLRWQPQPPHVRLAAPHDDLEAAALVINRAPSGRLPVTIIQVRLPYLAPGRLGFVSLLGLRIFQATFCGLPHLFHPIRRHPSLFRA